MASILHMISQMAIAHGNIRSITDIHSIYERYTKNAKKALIDNPQNKLVIGHSAGGSAASQGEYDDPNENSDGVTYMAPVSSEADRYRTNKG